MDNIVTISQARTADDERISVLHEMVAVVDNGEILTKRNVRNGSRRVIGIEYDITTETLAEIDEIIAAYRATDSA